MNELSWSFYQKWNESLESREERETVARPHLWASELGKSLVDNWLKMKGIQPSNPFDNRSLRKFEAGNIWEWLVGLVLKRAGLYIGEQEHVSYQYPDLIEVTGKTDFIAGGKPDWEKARAEVKDLKLPEFFDRVTENVIDSLEKRYGESELKTIVLEIKSCSSFMFDKYMLIGQPNHNHRLQCFHYLKSLGWKEGHVVYVSKDDARMIEFGVLNPSGVEDEYRKYIEDLSGYVKSDTRPPLEKPLEFDSEVGKFTSNWRVMYSQYLTLLYGYKNQAHFENEFRDKSARWNRVLTRVVEDKNMTKANLEVIKEIEGEGYELDKIVGIAKKIRSNIKIK